MAVVVLPSALRRYVGEQDRLQVPGGSVGAVLANLVASTPGMRAHLFAGDELRSFVAVAHNGRDVRTLDGLATPVGDLDELRVVSSIAGG